MKRPIGQLVIAVILFGLETAALAAFTPISFSSALEIVPTGINDHGQVVGYFIENNGTQFGAPAQGFLYSRGKFSPINAPGASSTIAYGINNLGQITGWSFDSSGHARGGFIKTGDNFTAINYPGASDTSPLGINDAGDIVGQMFLGNDFHGFLYEGGKFMPIDVPGNTSTIPRDINDEGQVVGDSRDAAFNATGFLYINGEFTPINIPGSSDTYANSINDFGQVLVSTPNLAFLYAGSKFNPIPIPNSGVANSMNNSGQIVGTFDVPISKPPFFRTDGFLTVVPEPGSLVFLTVGVLGLGLAWRHKFTVTGDCGSRLGVISH